MGPSSSIRYTATPHSWTLSYWLRYLKQTVNVVSSCGGAVPHLLGRTNCERPTEESSARWRS